MFRMLQPLPDLCSVTVTRNPSCLGLLVPRCVIRRRSVRDKTRSRRPPGNYLPRRQGSGGRTRFAEAALQRLQRLGRIEAADGLGVEPAVRGFVLIEHRANRGAVGRDSARRALEKDPRPRGSREPPIRRPPAGRRETTSRRPEGARSPARIRDGRRAGAVRGALRSAGGRPGVADDFPELRRELRAAGRAA